VRRLLLLTAGKISERTSRKRLYLSYPFGPLLHLFLFLFLVKQSIMSDELANSIVKAAKTMETNEPPYTIAAILPRGEGGQSYYVNPCFRGFGKYTTFYECFDALAAQGYQPVTADDPLSKSIGTFLSGTPGTKQAGFLMKKPLGSNSRRK
jgi:hypothetical protein